MTEDRELFVPLGPAPFRVHVPNPKLEELQRAVERYLDAPGCNNNSRVTALAKLRWALEESMKHGQ